MNGSTESKNVNKIFAHKPLKNRYRREYRVTKITKLIQDVTCAKPLIQS